MYTWHKAWDLEAEANLAALAEPAKLAGTQAPVSVVDAQDRCWVLSTQKVGALQKKSRVIR